MPRALIGLGANLGDRHAQLDAALAALASDGAVCEVARSTWRQTAPIGGPADQPNYVNGAALFETSLAPHALWRAMASVELSAGRVRSERWGPRTLDLDLLLYDDQIIADDFLTVPHPRLALRRFVLEPAAEIAPAMMHPLLGRTLGELAHHVAATRPLAAIVGGDSALRGALVLRIAQSLDIPFLIPGQLNSPAALRAQAAAMQSARPDCWLITPAWSEQPFLDGALPIDGDVELALLPRLLIVIHDHRAQFDPRHWPAAMRRRVGPIVYVDGNDPEHAAELAATAMLGLSDAPLQTS